MLTSIGNIHHSLLPRAGEIGFIVGLESHGVSPRRRCVVRSFPLCDNVWPYSHGVHCVTVEFLDNRETRCVSGFYFESDDARTPRTVPHTLRRRSGHPRAPRP